MGTRSLTRIIPRQEGLSFSEGHNHAEKAWLTMYRHYDGYPEGHGIELAKFLNNIKIINGVPLMDQEINLGKYANGVGCLGAQMIKSFKTEVGDIYIRHNEGGGDEDYIYTIFPKEGEDIYISIYKVYTKKCIFVGTPQQLIAKYKLNTITN